MSVNLKNARLPDGGPLYVETDLARHPIVEPWNTATALLFLAIALWWLWQLRDRQQPFTTLKVACALMLALGGIGGTLFHGTRSHLVWLVLDVAPIGVLILVYCLHVYWQLGRLWQGIAVSLMLVAMRFSLSLFPIYEQAQITLGYAILGLVLLIPLFLYAKAIHWQQTRHIAYALAAFAIALVARLADSNLPTSGWIHVFPMGTHFIWHLCGALAVVLLIRFWMRTPALVRK